MNLDKEKVFLEEKSIIKNDVSGLNSIYTFDNFVVNSENEFVYIATSQIASEFPKCFHIPVFIWGKSKVGKTHLLHAMGNKIKNDNPNSKVIYITAQQLFNEVIESIKNNKDEIIKKYTEYDVLLIDNIQYIASKKTLQEKIFHILNYFLHNNKLIVFSSDRLPGAIPDINHNLKARFEWGIVCGFFSTEKTLQINNDYFKMVFKELIVDERNEDAYIEVEKIGNNKEIKYLLIVYGENDILKIHLINVLEDKLRAKEKIIRILSGNFIDELVNSVTKSNLTEIEDKYRSADTVIIEDIDYIVGKKSTQLELYYIVKYCIENNKKIIFTSRLKVEELHLDNKLKELLRLGKSIEIKNV